jgi:hypothetical protein
MSIHHPHINLTSTFHLLRPLSLLPFLLLRIVKALKQVARLIKKKKKNPKRIKAPKTSDVGSKKLVIVDSIGSVDEVNKIKMKNPKPKFPLQPL